MQFSVEAGIMIDFALNIQNYQFSGSLILHTMDVMMQRHFLCTLESRNASLDSHLIVSSSLSGS